MHPARGADLVIPHQSASGAGGITNATFTRNFILGSDDTLGGAYYASNAVRVETDIAYGSVAGGNRYFSLAANDGLVKSTTNWNLTGPVHELTGIISGDNVVMYPHSTKPSGAGIVRISNTSNSLTGTSIWLLGGTRSSLTTLASTSVVAPGNMGDLSNAVLIFTSDAAFGGAAQVEVASRGSSGVATAGMLLFEDTNGAGSTTFSRSFSLLATATSYGAAGWGSYGGDAIYTGTVTMAGNQSPAPLHVQSGTLTLNGATITNNRSAAGAINKGGAGELIINSLTVNGSQATNAWNVYQGKLSVNTSLAAAPVTIFDGSTLGGSGTINGNVTVSTGGGIIAPGNSPGTLDVVGNVTLTGSTTLAIELGGSTPGDGSGFYDQVNATGTATLASAILDVTTFGGFNPAGGIYYLLSRSAGTGTFASLPEGAVVTIDGGLGSGQITYLANWTGTQAGSSLTGGNDVALYNVTYVPEPATLGLIGLGALALGRRRRLV